MAHRLFGDRGYHQTTTNHIAQAAGVSSGSFYAYDKDREEILSELNLALDDLSQEKELRQTDIRLWVQRVLGRRPP